MRGEAPGPHQPSSTLQIAGAVLGVRTVCHAVPDRSSAASLDRAGPARRAVAQAGGQGQPPSRPGTIPFSRCRSPPSISTTCSGRRASRPTAPVTIPFAFEQCELTGRVDNFVRAAKALRGEPLDEQEAAGLSVRRHRHLQGDRRRVLHAERASRSEARCLRRRPDREDRRGAGEGRLSLHDAHDRPAESASVGRARSAGSSSATTATSSTTSAICSKPPSRTTRRPASARCSNIAIEDRRSARQTFGPGKKSIWPGHQITEMGLVKLYRGHRRGAIPRRWRSSCSTCAGPSAARREGNRAASTTTSRSSASIEQTEPVGHAVRATYMYSGMADVAALTGDRHLRQGHRHDLGQHVARSSTSPAASARPARGEAFGSHYELPNMTAYNETCASIGKDYWNHRLFLLHGDAKYIDVMERTLYNGLISGVSLDGKTFFYPNPLESNGQHERSPWFGVACCPGEHHAIPARRCRATSTRTQRDARLRQPLCGRARPTSSWTGGKVKIDAGDALSVGRRGEDHGHAGSDARPSRSRCGFPAGRATSRCRAISIASPTRSTRRPRSRSTARPAPLTLDKGYVDDRAHVEARRRHRARRCRCRCGASWRTRRSTADAGRVALQRGPIVYAAEWPDNAGRQGPQPRAAGRRAADARVPRRIC